MSQFSFALIHVHLTARRFNKHKHTNNQCRSCGNNIRLEKLVGPWLMALDSQSALKWMHTFSSQSDKQQNR